MYLTPLSKNDNDNSHTPFIVGKAISDGFDKNNVVTDADINREGYKWMEKWPYYIKIHNVQLIKENISEGASLNQLLSILKNNFYSSTKGKNLSLPDLKKMSFAKIAY